MTADQRWTNFAFLAAIASLILHAGILYWFQWVGMGFGAPLVDPIEPRRFHLQRATVDPKSIAREEQPLLPAQRKLELNPEKISAFSGELKAPSIPLPRVESAEPQNLGAVSTATPVRAFSALPVEQDGNLKNLAQALAKSASTEALNKTTRLLKQNNLGGGEDGFATLGSSTAAAPELPKFEDISSLVDFQSPAALERPAFQPILLRLSSDVLFEFDSALIQPSAISTLEQVTTFLAQSDSAQITVEGHTDTIGEAGYNQSLSEQRARAVAEWLSGQIQLQNHEFFIRGFGETRPIVNPHGDQRQQAPNRRVEIRVEAKR